VREQASNLVARAIEGDITAFAALVERYQGMVYGLALSTTGSSADAEDIAQQAFVAAYQELSSLRDTAKFASWLRGIALNKIGAWQRRRCWRWNRSVRPCRRKRRRCGLSSRSCGGGSGEVRARGA
jgi:RNA polymerase sigma factor (sigma-70 family)